MASMATSMAYIWREGFLVCYVGIGSAFSRGWLGAPAIHPRLETEPKVGIEGLIFRE